MAISATTLRLPTPPRGIIEVLACWDSMLALRSYLEHKQLATKPFTYSPLTTCEIRIRSKWNRCTIDTSLVLVRNRASIPRVCLHRVARAKGGGSVNRCEQPEKRAIELSHRAQNAQQTQITVHFVYHPLRHLHFQQKAEDLSICLHGCVSRK
jgi:hypothetical protein